MRFVLGKDHFRIVMSSAGVPMMATRGQCIILGTWLLLCLCSAMCFLLSIVCPLPSCNAASVPHYCFSCFTCVSLVTLLVCLPTYSPGVCSPVLIRCFTSCVCYVCLFCSSLPACLSPLGVFFIFFIIKRETILPAA